MSSRTSFKPVEVQVVYGECAHVLRKMQVIPIQVPTGETSKKQKRNSTSSQSSKSSKSSRRNSWKSFLCSGAEQVESESDNEADLEFQCQGLQLVENIAGLCPDCTARQERKSARQQARSAEIIRAQVAQEQDDELVRQRREYRRMEDRRTKFRCNKCIKEDRYPIDRSGTDGFCCEFGRSFWDENIKAERQSIPTAEMKRMTINTTEARHAASKAANSYGWKPHGDEFNSIEPEVVSQYISIPGNQPGTLPGPAVPRYQDAHIDIERWNAQVRTNHGSYPGTAPPPNKPLPSLPPRKTRAENLRIQSSTRRHEPRKEALLRTKDSEMSVMSTAFDIDSVSPVSPINSRWPSNAKRPSRREEQDDLMASLENEVNDALESWQQPQPQERSRRSRR